MNSQIWYVGEYSIAGGKRDMFKRLIEEVIEL
jgi:hypothetical protein